MDIANSCSMLHGETLQSTKGTRIDRIIIYGWWSQKTWYWNILYHIIELYVLLYCLLIDDKVLMYDNYENAGSYCVLKVYFK